ncbi:olfactory receptor 14J1-like [Zonotrichia albicollis]|uniref:olfactory receptor 14J1-like n=1 Tax=Zonotrichia albicollis TaxID=44394 RepID=UPI003D80FC20
MCYDRYVSICKPLHYGTLLGSRACANMAAAAWASAFLNALLHTANIFSLPLCHGNVLGQFFCDVPQILKLSCSKSYLREQGLLAVSLGLAFGCFVFMVFSYVQIFRAVLRIPSEQGQHKAFSTCLPHLAVVSLFISAGTFSYLKPPSISSPSLDLALSVLYSVVPPALNPLIYSLRNQELKEALRKFIGLQEVAAMFRQLVSPVSRRQLVSGCGPREALSADGFPTSAYKPASAMNACEAVGINAIRSNASSMTPSFRTGKAVKQRLAHAGEATPLPELTVKPELARAEPARAGEAAPPLEL